MTLGPPIVWGSDIMSVKHGRGLQLFKSAKMHSNPEPGLFYDHGWAGHSLFLSCFPCLYKDIICSSYSSCEINDKGY